MVNEQSPDVDARTDTDAHCAEKSPDLDRLLAAVEAFCDEPDRASLLRRIADATRDLLACDEAALVEGTGGEGALSGPLRAALLERGRTAGRPSSVAAGDLLHVAHDALPIGSWAVAPLPGGGAAPRAVVAGWRHRHEPRQRELRALGLVARWAATALELRDRRAALEASVRASEEFVSAAAHELRTPLTPLRLTVDRAARALDVHGDHLRARGALTGVDEHLRRMTHLVDTLLEASRVARGDLILVRRDTDLPALIHEVLERHAEAARHSRCDISVHFSERIVGRWDAQRLREAVAQLIANAIKFGGGSPVRVELSSDHHSAHLLVQDAGRGIDAADHERIFDRFERAVSVRNFGGLGVGLWLAREIARAHGGDVTVESALGQGAAFSLRLPLVTGRTAR